MRTAAPARAELTGPDEARERVFHVAITPWLPLATLSPDSTPWTILPVRCASRSEPADKRPHSSLQFSSNGRALQSFASALRTLAPSKAMQKRDTPIEIRISEVVPVGLDTIYVKLDTDALKKLEEVHDKFGGGFGAKGSLQKKHHDASTRDQKAARERKYRNAVRGALDTPAIVHAGDLLSLPLPAHPITHVPAPPAKVTACEPVSQGIVLPSTQIVILPGKSNKAPDMPIKSLVHRRGPSVADGIPEEDEDTSNEQFFSAAEDIRTQPSSPPDEGLSDTEASGDDLDDLSDDADDIITLSAPALSQTSGVLTGSAVTPRPGQAYPNGIATPGSMYSSFSVSTVRGGTKSKTFKAFGLLEHLPDELLHPKPATDDDDETRIFIDTTSLVKIGCFSGDWVRIEAAADAWNDFGQWHLGSFGHGEDEEQEWRVARVYGLPEVMSRKDNRYYVHKTDERPVGLLGGGMLPPTSSVHLSPILLANLGSPSHLKISALAPAVEEGKSQAGGKGKVPATASPPLAKEVTLLKLSTPLSSERVLQPSLFAGLKLFFERKRRVVKRGDLVGIPIDESLSRAVFEGGNADDATTDELLSGSQADGKAGDESRRPKLATGVAWFKIGEVVSSAKDEADDETWGGITSVDASNTKMVQAGSEQGEVPPTMSSTWQYYLGLKKPYTMDTAGPVSSALSTELPKPYVSPLQRRLRELISAATSPRAIHLKLPPVAILLTSTQRSIGKATVAEKACEDLGLHTFTIDAYDILTEGGDQKTEAFLKARAERALTCGNEYTALLVKHVDKLDAERMIAAMKEILADLRILVATTTDVDKVPEGIRSLFTHELEMTAPDEAEREGILRGVVEDAGIRAAPDVSLSSVAVKTAALVAGDLLDVVDRALIARQVRLSKIARNATKALAAARANTDLPEVTVKDLTIAGHALNLLLTPADFTAAVDAARKNFADSIGAPKIPNVQWSDVGGLSHVKSAVIETIQLPLSRPELFARGMKKRSGILFYGPPGTGKTLLAKAIATEFSLNFFSVKGPELLNMYIGESEANVRRVFQRARDARPCVVFFDELDSVAPKRGNQGDSGGVMDRIVSQLLAELDGMSGGGDGEDGAAGGGQGVFVIGATNRPDLLDQALLRPGRFDKMLYLGVNDTHEGQLKVLEALTRKWVLRPDRTGAKLLIRGYQVHTPSLMLPGTRRFRIAVHLHRCRPLRSVLRRHAQSHHTASPQRRCQSRRPQSADQGVWRPRSSPGLHRLLLRPSRHRRRHTSHRR
ncbi:MAG: ATP-binding protein [Terriglobus roseus]|nr:ATP-binding protein [Terriglobus roseus]